jgi:hypothetical protein
MSKIEQAKLFLQKVKSAGIEPKLEGSWVTYDGVMNNELFSEAMKLQDEIAKLLSGKGE